MYTVIHNSNNDCYKQAYTDTEVIYVGRSLKVASAHAVETWLRLFQNEIDYVDNEEIARELSSLLEREEKDEEYYHDIHSFFEDHCEVIWEPEYITRPTEEVLIQRGSRTRARYSKINKLAKKVIKTVNKKGDTWI